MSGPFERQPGESDQERRRNVAQYKLATAIFGFDQARAFEQWVAAGYPEKFNAPLEANDDVREAVDRGDNDSIQKIYNILLGIGTYER